MLVDHIRPLSISDEPVKQFRRRRRCRDAVSKVEWSPSLCVHCQTWPVDRPSRNGDSSVPSPLQGCWRPSSSRPRSQAPQISVKVKTRQTSTWTHSCHCALLPISFLILSISGIIFFRGSEKPIFKSLTHWIFGFYWVWALLGCSDFLFNEQLGSFWIRRSEHITDVLASLHWFLFQSASCSKSRYLATKQWTAVRPRTCRPTSPASLMCHLDWDSGHLTLTKWLCHRSTSPPSAGGP